MKVQRWDGKPISTPGIYSGVPMEVYHGANLCDAPSISSSGLRKIASQSPAHYWCESPYNPDRIDPDESEPLVFGRAAHHLLLGEDDFNTLYVVRPDKWDSWRTDAAKAWKAEQEAQGRTVLLKSQLETIRGLAKSLATHPLIEAGILNGAIEQTIVWRCKDTGIWLKARPDAIPNDAGDFADLKTTTSVQTADLARTIAENGYHQQAALIAAGWHAITGRDVASFSFVFVEKKPPYCTRIVTLRDEDLARGERQNFVAAKTFAKCLATGEWHGPGGADAEYLALPSWAQNRIDHELELAEAQ
ncbi:PD-(D/E)XK nuclease-like domain-containing protein [Rhodopseudomonas sp. B29]|uniref:PD-(D/E)XK nuclease-like domain-containing protein n=1 Tax=Rhodopseudomonas sp. B29 TaxID=95607 RepID=UPI0003481173|nr:PD-(D/E)XK nuclease-like domain-containing protein [Rhodopseudomonas sp. B29]